MKTVAEVIGISRSNLIERMRERPKKRIGRPPLPDDKLVAEIKAVIAELPTYGYRRVHAILERQALAAGLKPPNHKRVYRVMKVHGLLLDRHAGGVERRHDGRSPSMRATAAGAGGAVAAIAALKNPSLVRSLILYEPALGSVLPADSPEGKTAREDRAKIFGPATAAAKAGDTVQAVRILYEAIYQLPPGSFEGLPQSTKAAVLENARTRPLAVAAPPANVTCDALKAFTRPTLVMWGEKTQPSYALVSEGVANCVPGAQQVVMQNVNHNGPVRDPDAFSAAVLEFLAKRQGF